MSARRRSFPAVRSDRGSSPSDDRSSLPSSAAFPAPEPRSPTPSSPAGQRPNRRPRVDAPPAAQPKGSARSPLRPNVPEHPHHVAGPQPNESQPKSWSPVPCRPEPRDETEGGPGDRRRSQRGASRCHRRSCSTVCSTSGTRSSRSRTGDHGRGSRDVGAGQRPLSSAAASPAMRPNTDPAVRPVPPG